jgi:site-specific recombinase XerD
MNAITPNLPAVIIAEPALPTLPPADIERAINYARQDKAESTRRAYRSDFAAFQVFCRSRGVDALPALPETVAAFLASEAEAGLKPSTIGRRCAAIRYASKLAGHEPPTDSEAVKATLRGIRRTVGVAPRKLAAATAEKVIGMQTLTRRGIIGKRDKALLLLGFSLAARRSELVSLDFDDITECPEGLRVRIKRSKTDQESQGVTIAVCRGAIACPVKALREYLDAAGITSGPVFVQIRKGGHVTDQRLSGEAVRRIVKLYAAKLGLDPKQYGAHSLRAGAITSAASRGASVFKISDVSRHKSIDVLAGYVRDSNLFTDHCLSGLL